MPENEEPLVLDGEHKQHLDKAFDDIDNILSGPVGEFLKHRISYFDKLIILNGGTLALSFSAAATFYAHAHAAANGTHIPFDSVLTAWKLLMFSIVAALVSNWLTIIANEKVYVLEAIKLIRLRTFVLFTYFRDAVPNIHIDWTSAIRTPKIAKKEQSQGRVAKWGAWAAFFLGLLSQLATIASYFYLYKFVGANIQAL
jgi:hypothetical protein